MAQDPPRRTDMLFRLQPSRQAPAHLAHHIPNVTLQGFIEWMWIRLEARWASDRKIRGSKPGLDRDHILIPITINRFAGVSIM
jgi:hypothetical protein